MQTLSLTHKILWVKRWKILFARNPLEKNSAIFGGRGSKMVSHFSCGAQIKDYHGIAICVTKKRDYRRKI